jgi:hypothetical protein
VSSDDSYLPLQVVGLRVLALQETEKAFHVQLERFLGASDREVIIERFETIASLIKGCFGLIKGLSIDFEKFGNGKRQRLVHRHVESIVPGVTLSKTLWCYGSLVLVSAPHTIVVLEPSAEIHEVHLAHVPLFREDWLGWPLLHASKIQPHNEVSPQVLARLKKVETRESEAAQACCVIRWGMGKIRVLQGTTTSYFHVVPSEISRVTVSPERRAIDRYLEQVGSDRFVEFVSDILVQVEGHTVVDVTDGPGDEKQDILSHDRSGQRHLTQCKHTSD